MMQGINGFVELYEMMSMMFYQSDITPIHKIQMHFLLNRIYMILK